MIRMEREQYDRLRTDTTLQIAALQKELRKLKARLRLVALSVLL